MNILLLTISPDRLGATLCVVHGTAERTLEGEVIPAAELTIVELRDAEGGALLHEKLAGSSVASGIKAILRWLAGRNIRVDLVGYPIELHAKQDQTMRLTATRVENMGLIPMFKEVLASVRTVSACAPALPQYAYFAVRPRSAEEVAVAVAADVSKELAATVKLQAPADCPQKRKLRCETCSR